MTPDRFNTMVKAVREAAGILRDAGVTPEGISEARAYGALVIPAGRSRGADVTDVVEGCDLLDACAPLAEASA